MEGTVKVRLLLTSALFLFVQNPTMHAQVTVDVAKITCQQLQMGEIPWTQREVVLWLSGYYNGKKNEDKVSQYCYGHRDTTVMDAVKNVLGVDK